MKIERSKFDIIINILCLLSLVGTAIFLIITWNKIPARVPGHYNAAGEIDNLTDKSSLIILLITSWIMYIGLSVVEKYPQIWNTGVTVTEENKTRVYRVLKNMLITVKLLTTVVFSYLTIQSTTGENLPLLFIPIFLVLMFGSLSYFIFRLVKAK